MVRPGKASAAGFGNDPFFAGGSGGGSSGGGRGGGGSRGGGKSGRAGSSSRGSNGAASAATERAPKRSRQAGDPAKPGSKLAKRREEGLEVHSDDEDAQGSDDDGSDDESEDETPAEKRLRLAKELIARAEAAERDEVDGHDIDAQAISHRLMDEHAIAKGILRRKIAAKCPATVDDASIRRFRHRGLPVTCLAVLPETQVAFVGSKDGSITKWSLTSGERLVEVDGQRAGAAAAAKAAAAAAAKANTYTGVAPSLGDEVGHAGAVLALAVSTDGTLLASGGVDRLVVVWEAGTLACLRKFKGHRNTVTCLVFRRKTHELFSGSDDRTIKIWNLDAMSYVETLYGHQEGVLAIDSLDRERAVSCGGRDRTVRLWKVVEESHNVYSGDGHSIDCVAMLTEGTFVSGSESGVLALWDSLKKKPVATVSDAHGPGHWITSVAAVPYGDLCASGSDDGTVRLWLCDPDKRKLSAVTTIPVIGFVTALVFDPTGRQIIAAVSQEHRLGRWSRIKAARNGIALIPILKE